MLRAVLFDLDGTLLDIDLDRFLRSYFDALGPYVADVTGLDARTALGAVMSGTDAMFTEHLGATNREVFNDRFRELTGADLAAPRAVELLDRFYSETFPTLQHDHGPRSGGAGAVTAARQRGMKTALATNPIFPMAAIRERMRWAELNESCFDYVTSYEAMEACKPRPAYFAQTAAAIGVAPDECLMVGDDPKLDLAATNVGMQTFYVGIDAPGLEGQRRGSLADLTELLLSLSE